MLRRPKHSRIEVVALKEDKTTAKDHITFLKLFYYRMFRALNLQ